MNLDSFLQLFFGLLATLLTLAGLWFKSKCFISNAPMQPNASTLKQSLTRSRVLYLPPHKHPTNPSALSGHDVAQSTDIIPDGNEHQPGLGWTTRCRLELHPAESPSSCRWLTVSTAPPAVLAAWNAESGSSDTPCCRQFCDRSLHSSFLHSGFATQNLIGYFHGYYS